MARTAREFLQLAQTLEPNSNIGGAFCSEKLDGVRCIWIPTTVDKEVRKVPFANLQKDTMNNAGRPASGLWSRYGNPIWAPSEWIDRLPDDLILDGELWTGRGKFENTISTVKKREGIWAEWNKIEYKVFETVHTDRLFTPGKIHNNMWKHFVFPDMQEWIKDGIIQELRPISFELSYFKLKKLLKDNETVSLLDQRRLSFHGEEARRQLDEELTKVIATGGEGCMLRQGNSVWEPYRATHLLKVKPDHDSEGLIIGWSPGEGRLQGMMGSLTIGWTNPLGKPVVFNLSGFSDAERTADPDGEPDWFDLGETITFKYRELTDDGMPKEARYFRKRND